MIEGLVGSPRRGVTLDMVGFFRGVTNHMDEEVSDGLVGIRCNDSVSRFINLHLAKNKGGVT